MTGWAQVHGWRGRTSLRKRIQYDLDYIQRWSFWLDFRDPAHDRPARRLGQDLVDQSEAEARGLTGPAPEPQPLCSVVIPTYNGRALLETCLASIARHRPGDAADRGHRRRRRLDRRHGRLARRDAIPTSGSSGSSATAASAPRPTRGSPPPGASSSSCSTTTPRSPPAGSRRAWLRSPTRRSARSPRWSWSAPTPSRSIRPATRTPSSAGRASEGTARPPAAGSTARPSEVFGASGSSAFYRAEALRRVGGFDPSFGSYYEDVDLAFRLRWAGYACVFTPALPDPPRRLGQLRPRPPGAPAADGPERRDPLLVEPARPLAGSPRSCPHLAFTLGPGRLAAGPRPRSARSCSASSTPSASGRTSPPAADSAPTSPDQASPRPISRSRSACSTTCATTSDGRKRPRRDGGRSRWAELSPCPGPFPSHGATNAI